MRIRFMNVGLKWKSFSQTFSERYLNLKGLITFTKTQAKGWICLVGEGSLEGGTIETKLEQILF